MNKLRYTKEPWYIGQELFIKNKVYVPMPDGIPYVVADTNMNFREQGIADAERIVLCVNFCAGLSNDFLVDMLAEKDQIIARLGLTAPAD